MSNIIIKIDNDTVLTNETFNILNKPKTYLEILFRLQKCCEEIISSDELDIQKITLKLIKDVFPSHSTKITVVPGCEAIIPIIINILGLEMITIASGQTVATLLTDILVDDGKGTAKVYTDSSKTTEAAGTDPVSSIMVLEATAQDNATIITYLLRKQPSDITTITISDSSVVTAIVNTLGFELVDVVSGKTVNELLSAILVDGGEGTKKVYTDSSKTVEAIGTDTVTTTMILESTAEDTVTKVDYEII